MINNENQSSEAKKFLQVDCLYFKLPPSFNGTVGDALIECGKYLNSPCGDEKSYTYESDDIYDDNITVGEFRGKTFEHFKGLYDVEGRGEMVSMCDIFEMKDGEPVNITRR